MSAQQLVANLTIPAVVIGMAFRAAAVGIQALVSDDEIECHVTTAATVAMPRRGAATIAVDGELLRVTPPVRYEFVPRAVRVVRW